MISTAMPLSSSRPGAVRAASVGSGKGVPSFIRSMHSSPRRASEYLGPKSVPTSIRPRQGSHQRYVAAAPEMEASTSASPLTSQGHRRSFMR